MKTLMKTAALVASLTFAVSAIAQPPRSPEDQAKSATELRQAVFKLLGSNMGPLGGMARGAVPFNAALAEKNGTRISQLSMMITDTFRMDTREFDLETESLDVIWEDADGFAAKAAALTDAADALVTAAASGDEGATKRAIGGVGRTCGSCHDDFRVEN